MPRIRVSYATRSIAIIYAAVRESTLCFSEKWTSSLKLATILVSSRVLTNSSITPEIAGKILSGGARLYGFTEDDFDKSTAAARRHGNLTAGTAD